MNPSVAPGLGLGLLLLAAVIPSATADAAPARACSKPVIVTGDYETFRQAGRDVRPARFAALVATTRERFNAAARRLCAAGVLRPADLARFRRVAVQNGEGATEPLLYQEEGSGRGIFIFQYAFLDGGPPEPAEFEKVIRCWKRPRNRVCDLGD